MNLKVHDQGYSRRFSNNVVATLDSNRYANFDQMEKNAYLIDLYDFIREICGALLRGYREYGAPHWDCRAPKYCLPCFALDDGVARRVVYK